MKILKYRSVVSTFCVALLSVFLFTSCEKESDGPSSGNQKDRLEKFKRLRFTALNSSNSSGTYVGNNGNVTFVSSNGNGSTFTQTTGSTSTFTDPSSTGTEFTVSSSFGEGGGNVTLDGTKYEMDFGFCASADFLNAVPKSSGDSTNTEKEDGDVNLDLFIGISGDFDITSIDEENEEGIDQGIDLILYTFSYNGATKIGSFDDFGEDDIDDFAFVIAVEYGESEDDVNLYFATEGSVNFSGTEVLLSSVKMAEVDFDFDDDNNNGNLSKMLVDLQANLECVSFEQ